VQCPAQWKQFVHRDWEAGFVAKDIVGGRVPDEEHLDARLVENFSCVLVVGCEHRKMRTLFFDLLQMVGTDSSHQLRAGGRRRCGRLGVTAHSGGLKLPPRNLTWDF